MKALLEQNEQVISRPTPHVTAQRLPGVGAFLNAQIGDLCQRLERLRKTREIRSILITSTTPREGKTLAAVDVAIALAKKWPRVLLVDADLRKAGVAAMLELSPLMPGFAEGLEQDRDLSTAVRFVEPLNIHWLPAGCPSSGEPEKVLHNSCLRNRLTELNHEFDWVILDSPSLQSPETRLLSNATDVVAMVVKPGAAPREQVTNSVASLDGAFLAGVVFQEASSFPSLALGTN